MTYKQVYKTIIQTIFIKTIAQIILQLLIKSISTMQNYIITACIPKLL